MTLTNLKERLKTFASDDSGASSIEYAIIAAGIMVVIVAVVGQIGANVGDKFQDVADGFN